MENFLKTVTNPLKLKLFFLTKLPLALIVGLKVVSANNSSAIVSVKYGYLTQNPFKSMYFACMAMAAELSTGVLVLNAVQESGKKISTLVTGLEAQFVKKGVGVIKFECLNGDDVQKALDLAIQTNESQEIKTESIGYNIEGQIVSKFIIFWSVKCKK